MLFLRVDALVSWSAMSKWHKKTSTHRAGPSPSMAPTSIAERTSQAIKNVQPPRQQVYVVNDIVNSAQKLSDTDEDPEDLDFSQLQLNASNVASFGIDWNRVPYDVALSTRVESISKLLILLLPVLLALLF